MDTENALEPTSTTNGSNKPKKAAPLIPTSDLKLNLLAKLVAAAWQQSKLHLEYATPDDLKEKNDRFSDAITTKNTVKRANNPVKVEISELEAAFKKAESIAKNLMNAKFGSQKAARQHFNEFNFLKYKNRYGLPTEKPLLNEALPGFIEGLQKYNIEIEQYPIKDLTSMAARYSELINQNTEATIDVTRSVGDKAPLREEISKILRSIAKLLEAHYPDSYQNKLREFGFLRENY